METNKQSKEILEQWHNDANNWKWGVFYFNKDDKRIFPPKKHKGLGWTINFANPLSIVLFLVLFFSIFALSYSMRK